MLKLIQVEFLKLRRRKFIWLMLLAALFMPLAAVFYFANINGTGVEPIEFYKWTAFSYTPWIILPVVLGMLCTMLMYNENQYDILKQLWIVPVNKVAYFFSKFVVVLTYSICFMLIIAAASILTGVLPGYITFDSASTLYLLRKCMEISLLTAFAVLPVLAVAAVQKGYGGVDCLCTGAIHVLWKPLYRQGRMVYDSDPIPCYLLCIACGDCPAGQLYDLSGGTGGHPKIPAPYSRG